MAVNGATVRLAQWPEEQPLLRQLRDQVFVQEQQVPVNIEWDERDHDASHFIAFDSHQNPIATARLLPGGQLGRMAVLPEWRNKGIGSQVLHFVLDWAKPRQLTLFLHAQVNAIAFYRRAGFVPVGERFMEAGIEHQSMRLNLTGKT